MIHPNRTVILSFRVTPDESAQLHEAAGERSVGDLIRTRLFDYAAVPIFKRLPGEAIVPKHDGQHDPTCLVCFPVPA